MATYKAQKVRLYPTRAQAEQLEKQFGANRWLWNHLLNLQIERHTQGEKHLSAFGMNYLLKPLKQAEEYAWLRESSSNSFQRVTDALAKAYEGFFKKRGGFPKFKSKRKSRPSATFSERLYAVYDGDGTGRITIPKTEGIKFRSGYAKAHEGKLKTITVSRDKLGKYFASLCYETSKQDVPKLPHGKDNTVGIDLGVKTFAVLSNGTSIEKPKNVEALAGRIVYAQQKLSRTQKGSNRRKRVLRHLNRLHISTASRRTDWLHKTTRQLVDDNQVNCYAVEDLSVAGMLHDSQSSLARKVQESCFRQFRTLLEQKLNAVGKTLGVINRYEASSKTCGDCGHVHAELTLSDRSWVCPACGVEHDRDVNASRNIAKMFLEGSTPTKKSKKPSPSGGRLKGEHPFEDMTEQGLPCDGVSTSADSTIFRKGAFVDETPVAKPVRAVSAQSV